MNERIHFDPTALNRQQVDGLACVVCGYEFVGPAVPVGIVDGGQVFACTDHHDARCTDCGTTRWTWIDTPNDTARGLCEQNHPGPTYDRPVRASVPGEWPDGEPASVRAAAEQAEPLPGGGGVAGLLALEDEFAAEAERAAADGNETAADALGYVTGALRYLRKTVDDGGDVGKGLAEVDKALSQASIVLATARESGDA